MKNVLEKRGYTADQNYAFDEIYFVWSKKIPPWIIRVYLVHTQPDEWSFNITNDKTGIIVSSGKRGGFKSPEIAADKAAAFLGSTADLQKVVNNIQSVLIQIRRSELGKTHAEIHAIEETLSQIIKREMEARKVQIADGTPGIRDEDAPCADFDPSESDALDFQNCDGDGHYLCQKCRNFDHSEKE